MVDLLSPFVQSNRLLKLTLATGSGIDENILLPYELTGTEGISEGVYYTLTCLSTDAFLELKQFIGVPVQVTLLTDDGSERALCGIVTRAEQQGANGGFSRIALTLEDPFAILQKRINSRVFQDLTVREFTDIVLQEHRQQNSVLTECFDVDDRCLGDHPKQSWVTQFNESDSSFLMRWLAQEGVSWYFEHGDEGAPSEHPKLTLVLFDDASILNPSTAGKVRFHRADGTENEDVITQWHGTRTLQPGSTQRSSYEYKAVNTDHQQDENRIDQGEYGQRLAATLEDYRFDTHHAANDGGDYARYGKLRIQAHEYATKFFTGHGNHRELTVGRHFELTQHDVHDQDNPEQRQFTVTRHQLFARNNLPVDILDTAKPLLHTSSATSIAAQWDIPADAIETGVFRNRFDAVRKDIPIVPAYSDTEYAKPVAPPLMTATVVGPPGEEIHVNEYGCIKVRMGFTRSQDHAHAQGAGASDSDRDAQWIRVAQPWTGSQYGHLWTPRVGDEVLIQYVNGDIDRPIVTGSVSNGTHRPAQFSDAGNLPGNKTLSGMKSKMYKGSGYNELIFDDTTDQLRAKLSSEHAKTQLNQGYLVHPRADGKGEPRGEGFELRSDAAGAIRAARGLLLSAESKSGAGGKQLDREALIQLFDAALALAERLGDHAAEQQANKPETGRDNKQVDEDAKPGQALSRGHLTHLNEAVHNLERSSNTDRDAKSGKGDQPGGQAIVAVSGPHGVAVGSQQNVTIAAGTNLDQVAQRDLHQATGRRWIHNVAESISLFVSGTQAKIKNTFKIIAARGNLQMQAQDGEIEATAQSDIKITSVNGKVIVQAPNEILLTAGSGYIRIGANIEIHNPGTQSQKAASFSLAGPTSLNPPFPIFPKSVCKDCLLSAADAGAPVAAKGA